MYAPRGSFENGRSKIPLLLLKEDLFIYFLNYYYAARCIDVYNVKSLFTSPVCAFSINFTPSSSVSNIIITSLVNL